MPTSITPDTSGTFTNSVDITMDIEGTMDDVVVPDPDDSSKHFTISGSIEHYMKMSMQMTMSMAAQSNAITPDGTLDLELRHTSTLTVINNDGVQATFKLTFEDNPDPIDLGSMGPGSADQMPSGANAYQKTAKLYTYDEKGKLLTEADVSIMDIPWMMGSLMGGGGAPSGGGTSPGGGSELPPPPPPEP
jgi:hypothetical protein